MNVAVRNKVVLKMTILAFLVALGYVLSPILRVPGMAPMQHFINVLTAVLLGPWYSLACAALIAFLRMTFMGINLLAVSGAVIGPIFAGLLYKKTGKLFAAVLGEIFGTGVIGALISGPIMKYIYGFPDIKWYTYLPSFLLGTMIGGGVAYLLLLAFKKRGVLSWMEQFCKE